jgi:hypothetical protein
VFFEFLPFWTQATLVALSRFLFWLQWSGYPAEPVRQTQLALQWEARASHTINKFNPLYVDFVVISDPTFISINGRDKSNTFIVAQRIQRITTSFITSAILINLPPNNSVSLGVDSKSSVFCEKKVEILDLVLT